MSDTNYTDLLNGIYQILNSADDKVNVSLDKGSEEVKLSTNALDREAVEDAVSSLLEAGDKLSWTYDDENNILTLDTTALDGEEVEDTVNSLLEAGDKLSWTYDDANDTLTINTTALDGEEVEDTVNSLLEAGDKLSWTYDDSNNTLTIDTTALDTEEVEDAVDSLLSGGTGISTTYDDANNSLTLSTNAELPAGSSSSASPGFGSWRTPNADRPVILEIEGIVETDGTSNAKITVGVDEDGGATSDYTYTVAYADSGVGSTYQDQSTSTIYIPAGSSYIISNISDPNSNNAITVREVAK